MIDYEKKYNDAMKKILSYETDEFDRVNVRPQDIFPELRESEDERIINSIIAVLENDKKHYLKEIAWLEKQKEQMPVKVSHKGLHKGSLRDGVDMKWMEENVKDDYLEMAINVLEHEKYSILAKALRSFRERILHTSHLIEWSEEDEKNIYFLTRLIELYIKDGRYETGDGTVTKPEIIKMLKSLRPSWKPSEEQMGALNYAYCELFKREDIEHNILGPLQRLCDDLMKL